MGVENVRNITNEIAVAGISPFMSRSNDALITSKVKGRFMDAGKFQINHVKVVTENSVVYLLGLVKRHEAQSAVEIASSTSGVKKVVKVFGTWVERCSYEYQHLKLTFRIEIIVSNSVHADWCGFMVENFVIYLVNTEGRGRTFMLLLDAPA